MEPYKKPKALGRGDLIAIVSPSSSISKFPKRIARAISNFQQLGFRTVLMPNALLCDGYGAGTPQQRADDINAAFARRDIAGILCSTGGLTANAILPLLDYDLIKSNPKVFCGFSDITTLLLAIASRSAIVTFHGPTLLPSFGDYEGPIDFTGSHFFSVVTSSEPTSFVPVASQCAVENLYWDRDDNRSLSMNKASEVISFGPKRTVSGILMGGNLQTIVMLLHTEFMPAMDGSILFLEEEGLSSAWYERYILELERAGVFGRISALMLAKPSNSFREDAPAERPLLALLKRIADEYSLPVLANLDCGHTKPLLTLPLGIMASLDTDTSSLSLIEGAVLS